MRTLLTVLVLVSILQSCSSSARLTDEERRKLDARLQFLFDETRPGVLGNLDVTTQPDGSMLVGVIIYCSNHADLRFLGDKVRTKMESLVTAKVGREDLRRILRLATVHRVEASTIQRPQ